MTRIGSNAPGGISLPPPSSPGRGEEYVHSLNRLPEELPPCSHTKLTSIDLTKLILPEGVDLSRIPSTHPIHESLNTLWLEITLRAVVSGGKQAMSSFPITPPAEPHR